MSVRIILDKGPEVYTNLDLVTGRVLLRLQREETLAAIVVKLECESRTRLAQPYDDRRNTYDTELEVHKLLYRTETVFPSSHLIQNAPKSASFTLPPGDHEYHFQFKLPFNNACTPVNSFIDSFHPPPDFENHIKRPLPPSLSGFRGEADIRYYVKVTAQRAAFYKENFRNEITFRFLPIEPIRPPPNRRESYARRQHQFAPPIGAPKATAPPIISVDGRLPDPAIITCNEPLSLRVLVKKLNESLDTIFLQLFHIVLVGYTEIRAHELRRNESSSWIIVSKANLNIPLASKSSSDPKDMELDNRMWSSIPLPNTVPPSFETCNLARKYELEISVGLAYGKAGHINPEMTVQPLRMPVLVYSGIKPPEALVDEMAKQQNPSLAGQNLRPPTVTRPSTLSQQSLGQASSSPLPTSSPAHASTPQGSADFPEEPPPSYEDAIADELAPVDGSSRPRNYEQPEGEPVRDEKRGSAFGRDDRLFP